jgi:chromosomal replication initiator protein
MYNTTPHKLLFSSLERRLGRQACETWFRPLEFTTSPQDQVLHIAAPNAVVKDWVIGHYQSALTESLAENELGRYQVQWSLAKANGPVSTGASCSSDPRIDARPSSEVSVKEDEATPFVEAVPSALNEKYNFSSFVVASCNRFAHAAAKAVAESPGKTYNPLYLYGGVGLGKTHLIQAAGHAIKSASPTLQVAYLSLERFMNELINAIRYGYDKTRVFRERYLIYRCAADRRRSIHRRQRANPGRILSYF